MVANGAREARPQRPGYVVRGDYDEESVALRTGDRYFGWTYEPPPAIIDAHVVVGVDPDLNGGAVALHVHPYDTGKAAELGVTYSTEKEEDALGVNVVKATAICEFARGLTSNGGTSVDVIIERGTAHGAFKCGYNVGCWAASARNGLHLTAFGRQFGRVVHVDGTTWTSGLWATKRAAYGASSSCGEPNMTDMAVYHIISMRRASQNGSYFTVCATSHKDARARC